MKLRWKILITLFFAFLAVYLFGAEGRPDLKSFYLDYNTEFFYGALPVNGVTLQYGNLSQYGDTGDMGRTDQRPDGSIVIVIDPSKHATVQQVELTVVHEMCHIKVWRHINMPAGTTEASAEGLDGHGPAFQGCMVDLAERGGMQKLW